MGYLASLAVHPRIDIIIVILQYLLNLVYSGYTLRSEIEAPLITREVLPETYFLLVIMAADAQAGPFLQFQASCSCGTL